MVAVEGSLRKPEQAGKVVQLGKGSVTDQMRPQPVPVRPNRRVDEDGHRIRVSGGCRVLGS